MEARAATAIASQLEELGPVRRRVNVEVAESRVQAELDRAFAELGARARLRGFRPGRAPRKVLERYFGAEVRERVLGKLIEEGYRAALERHELVPVGPPEVSTQGLSPGEPLRFSATVEVRPEVKVENWEGIRVERRQVRVAEADVDTVIASMREEAAELHPRETERVEAGDVVRLDMAGRLAGARPLRRENLLVEAGGGPFPGSLEDKLVGLERGATARLTIVYPPDFRTRELAGQELIAEVTIKDILAKELPPLDDDFARDHGGCDSLAELRARVRADLERLAAEEADRGVREAVISELAARHPFEVPSGLVGERLRAMIATLEARSGGGGRAAKVGEELRAELAAQAEQQVRAELLLDALAVQVGITVSEAELRERLEAMARARREPVERLQAMYASEARRAALDAQLRREKALALLVERADVTEVFVERAEVARAEGNR